MREHPLYLDLRWSMREGLRHAWCRRRIQRKILGTPPIRTSTKGPIEVRALTWRRDCIDLIWALKSFYFFSGVSYPLFIHDGGLAPRQHLLLRRHFPDAFIVTREEADRIVSEQFCRRMLDRCREYRAVNITTRKLFDFFIMSSAEHVISIDSDIVFFRNPESLTRPDTSGNRYNKDLGCHYSITPDEMETTFGLRPIECINSGLSFVSRSSIDFERINKWLQHPKLFADRWVTEQTLHALASALHGARLLPDSYVVSTQPGLREDIVCKHYTGFFRPLHYEEGMARLIEMGFLKALTDKGRRKEQRDPSLLAST